MIDKLNILQTNIKCELNKKIFSELYVLFVFIVSVIGWFFNSLVGISVLVFLATLMIVFTNDLKYVIPELLFIPFTINVVFTSTNVPVGLIVLASILLVVLIIFSIINRFQFKKMNSFNGFLGLAVFTIIPILWFKPLDSSQIMFYFLYFCNIFYLIVYVLMSNGIKENGKGLLCQSFSYLAIFLSIQSIISASKYGFDLSLIAQHGYYVGWGLCNEIGIMICFCIPFCFTLFEFKKNILELIYRNLFVIFSSVGIIFTGSRGSYIFFFLLVVILYFVYFFSINKKYTIIVFSSIMLLVLILLIININVVLKNIEVVFCIGLDDNGRIDLFKRALNLFLANPRNFFFGSGICSELEGLHTANGYQVGQIVYHSSLFETLVVAGICGFISLVIHFFEKYKLLIKAKSKYLIIGFVILDIYGMADNTYHMFYFMIPLTIVLATFDSVLFDLTKSEYLEKNGDKKIKLKEGENDA